MSGAETRATILYVDDEAANRMALAYVFEDDFDSSEARVLHVRMLPNVCVSAQAA